MYKLQGKLFTILVLTVFLLFNFKCVIMIKKIINAYALNIFIFTFIIIIITNGIITFISISDIQETLLNFSFIRKTINLEL